MVFSIAALGFWGCKPAEDTTPTDATATAAPVDDMAAVGAVTSTARDAADLRADAEALSQSYSEDATRLPADGPILRGRAAIRAAVRGRDWGRGSGRG